MKKILILFIFLSLGNLSAQINIPDANFKAKLLLANASNNIARDANYNSITIDTNNNGQIESSEALIVVYLFLENSSIQSLVGIESFVNLESLNCGNNLLSSIDISLLTNLNLLILSNNNLSILSLSNPNLTSLNFSGNFLTFFDSSNLPALQFINGNFNNIEILDFSNNLNFTQGDFKNNNLKNINFKNSTISNFALGNEMYQNNPNLQFVCVNDNFINQAQVIFNTTAGIPNNVVVNSYCSFNPGGTFYTIQGNTKYDANTNGCDSNDANYSNLKINLTDGTNTGSVIANTSGNYNLPVSAGSHTLTPVLENPTYFMVSPSSATVTFPAMANPFVQNFCISPNGMHNDLEITLIPISIAKAGFDASYKLKFKNKGTQTQSGTINFNFPDAVLDLVSSNPATSNTATNVLTYNFSNLQSFESREINIVFNLNSPTETPALNAGSILNFSASITGLADETPLDNVAELNQTVVNAFDPNDKICLEGTNLNPSKIGDYLNYKIRFENTGNANATNVVVKDIIDVSKFDIATLLMVATSHDCYTKISEGNKVEFIFENINLPFTANANDGYVVFKIKSKSNLVAGDQVSNLAQIYFDYNFPITTNTATSNFQTLGLNEFSSSKNFIISPNPTNSVLNITNFNNSIISSITIYNLLGQQMQTIINPNEIIDVSNLQSGNYIVSIKTEKATENFKFIKQ
jgi:uncharacterized repeat protein (TIGR01451 family)